MKMILQTSTSLPYVNTIVAALIGAVIGQLSILLVGWIKLKIDLCNKKKLIHSDLDIQNAILTRMKEKLIELKGLFENRKTESYTGDVFHDLHKDVFESVSKVDLYKIFKKDIEILFDIYHSFMFLKENSPLVIYGKYIMQLNNHNAEKKDDQNHEVYCETHKEFIKLALNQINSNLSTIEHVKKQIDRLKK